MDTPTRERLEQLETRIEKLEARIVDLERLKVVDHKFSEGVASQFREIKDSLTNRETPVSVVSTLATGSKP